MTRQLEAIIISLGIAILAAPGIAQDGGASDPPPADPPPAQVDDDTEAGDVTDPEEDDGLGSLDELLGLEEDDSASVTDGTEGEAAAELADPSQRDLEAKLIDQEPGEVLEQAIELMDQTAARLTAQRDTGLVTQRLQEDILRKLDTLIEQARQQQNQSSSSSSSSSQQQQQQQQQQPGNQQQQQDQQGENRDGDNQQEGAPPSRQDEQFRNLLDTAQAAWGMLPDRVRALLVQGLNDQYSEMYGPMTEEYYRRIAEEGESQ